MLGASEGFILAQGHFRTEQEIGKCSLVQDAVDDNGAVLHLEIETVFLRPESMEDVAIPLDAPEFIAAQTVEILLRDAEFFEQLELLQGPQSGNFGGADFIEDDLEHIGSLSSSAPFGKAEKLPNLREKVPDAV